MIQILNPTHFTKHSSSILDLFLVTCSHSVVISGVGERVFDQFMHCLIFLNNLLRRLSEKYGYMTK
jgi:hypothetical protein